MARFSLTAAFVLRRRLGRRGLEGIVGKRVAEPYRPRERVWVKTNNRATSFFADERDGVGRRIASRR